MVTRTTPCLANGAPAAPCKAPEPPTNPPPWIHTITGSLRAVGSAGRQTFRNRQSSDGAGGAGAPAGRRRAEPSLHAVRPVLRGLAHARPPRRRLGRPPPQVAHGRRREGDALEGDDAVVDHALQFAAIDPHDCRRLRTRRGANTRRGRQRGQRAREKSGHPRNRRGSVVPFCAHTSPFAVSTIAGRQRNPDRALAVRRRIVQAVSTRRLPKPPAESANDSRSNRQD